MDAAQAPADRVAGHQAPANQPRHSAGNGMQETNASGVEVDMALARRVLHAEAGAISQIARQLGKDFAAAAEAIYRCPGQVILTGIGKAGIIGQKISATFASTGTRSIHLHPVEALHGDLGRVSRQDVAVVLTHSGETEEVVRLIDHLKARGATTVALTGRRDSTVGGFVDMCLCYGSVEEACPLGLAPSVSTTCMLAVGDALALTVMNMRRFTPEDFAVFHPGGSLGRKLIRVEEAMTFRPGDQLVLAGDDLSVGEALEVAEQAPRRSGAMLLVDGQGRLSGILTDADLRRNLVGSEAGDLLSRPVAELMTHEPKHIHSGELASEALSILNQYRIDELPVVDDDHRPIGMIDVQDLLGIRTVSHARD
jgi:arabinose-5-phosphate isomerase